MIRIGAPPAQVERQTPAQNLHLWKQRFVKEGERGEDEVEGLGKNHVLLPLKSRNQMTSCERKHIDDDTMSVASFRSSSSHNSSRSSRSSRSLASNKSGWSLSSFRTDDSGFTYYANQRFAQLEKALEEERSKREQAEAKLDRLVDMLEKRELRKQ